MMNKRRAEGRQGSEPLGPQWPSLLLSACVALPACTLTSDSFDPVPVSSDDEGSGEPLDESSAPLNEDDAIVRGCSGEGAQGVPLNGDQPSCSDALGLLPSVEPSEADAGAVVEPGAPVSLPPCDGELGTFGAPEPITGLDFEENVFGPALSADGRTLYFSAYVAGEQQIYSATRKQRGAAFENPQEIPVVNSPASDGSPFISADGERLYLFSERSGGLGGRDVWSSQRQGQSASFAEPRLLAAINSLGADLLPWLSADELRLIFVSDRQGGRGGADLWAATRNDVADDFDEPVNLAELSSEQNEGRAVLSTDQLTAFFSSDREGGRGGADLWMAIRTQREQPFVLLLNLLPLNSSESDQDVALSSDGTELFFASSRSGASTLWRSARSCQ